MAAVTVHNPHLLSNLLINSNSGPNTSISFGADGTLYSENGHLYWESSDGTIQQITFSKNEIVKQIIQDL